MSKVTLNHMFLSASGKLCKKESTYIAYNKRTGKMYSAEYHEREQPNSDAQQEVKTTFASKAKAASAWWNANKPSTTNKNGTDDYQKVLAAYKSQTKFGNPYCYLRSLVADDLTITLPGSTTSTTTSSSSGSSSSSTTGELEGA